MAVEVGLASSILGIVHAAKSTAKGALFVYSFLKDAKHFDDTAFAFAEEVKALSTACEVVAQSVANIHQNYQEVRHANSGPAPDPQDLWPCLNEQLKSCQQTVDSLRSVLSTFINLPKGAGFWVKVQKQLALKLDLKEIAEARERVKSHTTGLQLVMHGIVIQISYLIPQHIDQQLQPSLAALTTLVETFIETRSKENVVRASDSQIGDAILKATKKIINDGVTIHESSTAAGSMLGAANPLRMTEIHRWLSLTDEIDQDQEADPSTDARSVFSSSNAPTSSAADEDRSNVGGALQRNDTEEDEFDDEFDDRIDLAQHSIERGREAFEKARYSEANMYLQEALQIVTELPIGKRKFCDTDDMRYMLAHCVFHTEDAASARVALVDVIDRLSLSHAQDDARKLRLCDTSHLLAQSCLRLRKLNEARSACQNALNLRINVLGKQHESVYESYALMATIHKLQGRGTRAGLYLERIPASHAYIIEALENYTIDSPTEPPQKPPEMPKRPAPSIVDVPPSESVIDMGSGQSEATTLVETPGRTSTDIFSHPPTISQALPTPPVNADLSHTYTFRNVHFRNYAYSHNYHPLLSIPLSARSSHLSHFLLKPKSDLAKMYLSDPDPTTLHTLIAKLPPKRPMYKPAKTYLHHELSLAAVLGMADVVEVLISLGASIHPFPNQPDVFEQAAKGGSIRAAELLIAAAQLCPSAALDEFKEKTYAVDAAVRYGRMDICDLLLAHGFKVSDRMPYLVCDTRGDDATPYLQAMTNVQRLSTSHRQFFSRDPFFANGHVKAPNVVGLRGETDIIGPDYDRWMIMLDALGFAVRTGAIETVKWALSVNATSLGPYTISFGEKVTTISAAELAAAAGQTDMVMYLLRGSRRRTARGAMEANGEKALKMAAINLQPGTMFALMDLGYQLEPRVSEWAFKQHRIAGYQQPQKRLEIRGLGGDEAGKSRVSILSSDVIEGVSV